jgi:peptidoglycan/xylan/chitin deacetylase (PgdA/CDA1 family)
MSGPRLARETLEKARSAGEDAIVLMHSWPRATARALPLIVQRLLERNSRFVGVDELIAS